jgi:hypothetical protein
MAPELNDLAALYQRRSRSAEAKALFKSVAPRSFTVGQVLKDRRPLRTRRAVDQAVAHDSPRKSCAGMHDHPVNDRADFSSTG